MNDGNSPIESIEIQTGIDPKYTVIWLHGLGADGNDFAPVVPQLGLDTESSVRFIFPHAPMRPITVNGGMVMRGWYDITDLPVSERLNSSEDLEGLIESQHMVEELIKQENRRGVVTKNIVLAGFSQGGAVALYSGLRLPLSLSGIIALSTYLPDASTLVSERCLENANTPIFYGHGSADPLIPLSSALSSRDLLKQLGYHIEWHTYQMPHSVHPLEIQHIGKFLNRLLVP